MRQIFISPRLENVEAVERLLNSHGIQTNVRQSRSYKGTLRRNFSFRDDARSEPDPSVWVVRPDDFVRARELLRAEGLLESTRPDQTRLQLPTREPIVVDRAQLIANRVRLLVIGLVVLIGCLLVLQILSLAS